MRIALSILSLGLIVWTLPAGATPFHLDHTKGKPSASSSRSGKHLGLDLRLDAESIFGVRAKRARYERVDYQFDWSSRRRAPGSVGPAVPEPSAAILFGAGLLVAHSVMPRRSREA